ncbi:MAG: phage-shock protein [Deltaproteobacteria bacterium]|nr:MAG: phage-shock protein [Deltaproteobacteria bacterium]
MEEVVFIVALVFFAPIIALAVIGATVLIAARIIKGEGPRRDKPQQTEEARTIQEVHQGLSRMEERVEALETILLDRAKEDSET